MGLVVLLHFAWNPFSFQRPCITPDARQKKLEVLTELLQDFKRGRSEEKPSILLVALTDSLPSRGTAGEAFCCFSTCTCLAHRLRRILMYAFTLRIIGLAANCQITTKR